QHRTTHRRQPSHHIRINGGIGDQPGNPAGRTHPPRQLPRQPSLALPTRPGHHPHTKPPRRPTPPPQLGQDPPPPTKQHHLRIRPQQRRRRTHPRRPREQPVQLHRLRHPPAPASPLHQPTKLRIGSQRRHRGDSHPATVKPSGVPTNNPQQQRPAEHRRPRH